jgi:hypothetical protein
VFVDPWLLRLYKRMDRTVASLAERYAERLGPVVLKLVALPGIRTAWALAVRHMVPEHGARELQLRWVPRYEHGSFTPGVADWAQRWRQAEGRRVLLYSPKDYSGSFFKWAEAINRHTDWAARVIAFQGSQFGHTLDLVLPQPGFLESGFYELLEEADVVHVKDECFFSDDCGPLPLRFRPFFDDMRAVLLDSGRPLVFTHYGGWARSLQRRPEYRKAVLACAGRVAMTPDLAYDWFDGAFIPHLIDTERYPFAWTDGRVVAHSPSTRARKGTELFLGAVARLDGIELDLIEGVPHAECVSRKRGATLFFDQAGSEINPRLGINDVIGWYGNSALEASVYGVPTMAHLAPSSFDGARRCGKNIEEACAIIDTPRTVDGMRRVMAQFFAASAAERREIAERTRSWTEQFHGYAANGPALAALYEQARTSEKPLEQVA